MIIDKTKTPWTEAHNDYLQMILETGCIGFILFALFIISKLREFLKQELSHRRLCMLTCLIVYLVSALSLFPMHLTQLSFLAIAVLACLEESYGDRNDFSSIYS